MKSNTSTGSATFGSVVETTVPARLDRLPWGRFHVLVIAALGITWILDGLEVTLVGALAGALMASPVLQFTNTDIGLATSAYLLGAVLGAIFFGWLTDRLGRKKLFFVTLTIYMLATIATAFSWNFWSFVVFRFMTGAGIGGEYTAVNSTIQELIPARVRGWTDLVINGSFWLGTAIGALGSLVLLDARMLPSDLGWRAAFAIGGGLSLIIFFMRLWIPESPRWLVTHGRAAEAKDIVDGIEHTLREEGHKIQDLVGPPSRLKPRTHTPLWEVVTTILKTHRQRAFVGLSLMASQAYFYNTVFFTYALILTTFYGVPSNKVGWYILPFALANFLGPLLMGRLFDTWGRRQMLILTYGVSGLLLAITGYLFAADFVSVWQLTLAWACVFFVGSAAASSAYLTVSESFPLEVRALAIAFFYAIGTGVGGVIGPLLLGYLIDTGSRTSVFWGYLVGASLMIGAAIVAALWAAAVERKPLEAVAKPLASAE
ncbi:major facilitator superfamily sugar transport protein [Hyphomicrobium denitrificans 1NES1]|uniref:Major facilitator superfamily sugar transport protein n=1 Tax=Hyphomicrobium denitrificans 1NES1 TaxID=670307 RepID=N0B6A5_9HYPH|nr:MFS transporter [Hyphomicrobium denitrificans]AGK57787.1 major facilitator superfamily sugar transport protein [Hyphomicrobium denitrificans 1NES1]